MGASRLAKDRYSVVIGSFDVVSANAETSLREVFTYLKAQKRERVIAIDEFHI